MITLIASSIPEELKAEQRWVGFLVENKNGKTTKMPINPTTGKAASIADPATWGSFDAAQQLLQPGKANALGFALGDGWAGIDLDGPGHTDATLTAETEQDFDRLGTYKERSISGAGLHYLGRYTGGKLPSTSVEIYTGGRFFIVTGAVCDGHSSIADITEELPRIAAQYATSTAAAVGQQLAPAQRSSGLERLENHDAWTDDEVREMISHIPADNYDDWLAVGMALKLEGYGFDLWDEWSRTASNYGGTAEAWRSFKKGDGVRLGTVIKMAEEAGWANPRRRTAAPAAALPGAEKCVFQRPKDLTDTGNGVALAKYLQDIARYSAALGWLVWDGMRWDDNPHRVELITQAYSDTMLHDAIYNTHPVNSGNGKSPYLAHAYRTRSRAGTENALRLARPHLAIKAEELDSNAYILNTPGGIVDLKTGAISPHQPSAYCTKITRCAPGADGAELWGAFLETLTGYDKQLEEYLQTVAGACIIGNVSFEGIFFAVGDGRNGKSTFFNTLCSVLGEYSGVIDSKILTTAQQNKGAAMATLRGRRLVICGELEEGQRLSVSTIKQLCSTDRITAERKYKDPEDFTPSHHLVLFTNFMPRVGSTDDGTWRRIQVLPFAQKMPTGKDDIPNYAEHLVNKAGAAILAWMIEGARRFIAAGCHLMPPESVRAATEEYKAQENWLLKYITDCCEIDKTAETAAGELYARYKAYAVETGDYTRRNVEFARAMEQAGYTSRKGHGGKVMYRGIRLIYEPII